MQRRSLVKIIEAIAECTILRQTPKAGNVVHNIAKSTVTALQSQSSFYCTTVPSRSVDQPNGAIAEIFDRDLKRKQRDRAAKVQDEDDPFLVEVVERLLDRLEDCKRSFPTVLVLGGAGEQVVKRLATGRAGVQQIIHADMSLGMLERARAKVAQVSPGTGGDSMSFQSPGVEVIHVQADEDFLPVAPQSVDLIVSCLALHWVNDLPGAMVQCRRALRPDGLLLAALLGGDTLHELRVACSQAELAVEGGLSARVSPMVQVRDAGSLLGVAGLNLPTVDVDDVVVHYPSPLDLVRHLRCLGETNAVKQRRQFLPRGTAREAERIYRERFGAEDGSVPATFQVLYMTGWAPHPSQQRPSRRGSATVSLEQLQEAMDAGMSQDPPGRGQPYPAA